MARAVHPELGVTYLGSQGDIWDAQTDNGCGTLRRRLAFDDAVVVVRALRKGGDGVGIGDGVPE